MDKNSSNRSGSQGRSRPQQNSQAQRNQRAERKSQKQVKVNLKPLPKMQPAPKMEKASKQEVKVVSDVVTQGRNGEQNIIVEWYWEQIGNDLPCGWIIGTAPGNQLEVTVNQRSYRKVYNGVSTVKTAVVPIAPEGTTGKVEVVNTTTGEKREIEFRWYSYGLFSLLWRLLKKLFTHRND